MVDVGFRLRQSWFREWSFLQKVIEPETSTKANSIDTLEAGNAMTGFVPKKTGHVRLLCETYRIRGQSGELSAP